MSYREESIKELQARGWEIPGENGKIHCPFHRDNTPSMSINLDKGVYFCFSCRQSGSLIFKKGQKRELTPVEMLKNRLEIYSDKPTTQEIKAPTVTFTYKIVEYPSKWLMEEWLKYRGIKRSLVDKYGITYGDIVITNKEDEYTVRNRVVIPVYENGKTMSLEMRAPLFKASQMGEQFKVKKCVYPKGSSANTLFNIDNLDREKKLYVLEGLMDGLAFESLSGQTNWTSVFGAAITNRQIKMLSEFKDITYVYNDDEAGIASIETIKKGLASTKYKGTATKLKPYDGYDDVGEMAQKIKMKRNEFIEWTKKAVSL